MLREVARPGRDIGPGRVEMRVIAIIGIGDRLSFAARNMIEQQRQTSLGSRRPHRFERGEILGIERDDMIEYFEVFARNLSGPLVGDIDAVAACSGNRARIGRRADMPIACACRIDQHFQSEPRCLGTQRRLGKRRTADIAEADEQYACRHGAASTPQATRAPLLPDGSVR